VSPPGTPATSGPIVPVPEPRMTDDYGAVGRKRIARGNRSTRRKLTRMPLCQSHDMTWGRTRTAGVESRRLIA
jgi:hypothetical protein